MDVVLFENFETPTQGVFCFVTLEECFACSEYMKELKKYNSKDWTVVACSKIEKEKMEEEIGVKFPITRFYNNSKIEFEMTGILYFTQIQKLYNVISSFDLINNNSLKISSLHDYKIAKIVQKPVEVQYFKVKDFLNVELLGKEITARNGEYVVLYTDGYIEVVNEENFIRRFA